MELALLLRELSKRRLLVGLGALVAAFAALSTIYHVGFFKVEKRSLEYATARTQVLVDSPRSSIADLNQDVSPLIVRAGVFSRLLTSPAALQVIGKEANIDPRLISAKGPFNLNQPRIESEPTADVRNGQLIDEADQYRLQLESDTTLPIVTILAQAPTTDEAMRLASGTAKGLTTYIEDIQEKPVAGVNPIPERQRVEIRQLGEPSGGVVNPGTDRKVAALVFLIVFGVWCVLILLIVRLVLAWRVTGALNAEDWSDASERDVIDDPTGRKRPRSNDAATAEEAALLERAL